jgi:hypothetical protein
MFPYVAKFRQSFSVGREGKQSWEGIRSMRIHGDGIRDCRYVYVTLRLRNVLIMNRKCAYVYSNPSEPELA